MILQATAKVGELDRRHGTGNTSIFFCVQFILAGIHQHSIPVDIPLIIDRLVGLTAVVKGNRVLPDILLALADLLAVVLPVNTMPVKVIIYAVLETGPNGRAWIGSWSINHDATG